MGLPKKIASQLSCLALLLLPSALWAQSFWDDEGPEDMIVSVYANNQAILPTLFALYDQQLYLPLGELARELGLPVTPDLANRKLVVTAAYQLPSYQIFLQEDGKLRVEQPGEAPELWPAEAWLEDLWEMDGELYLADEYLARLWPIEFDFNLSRLRLDLTTDEPLPELEARARQRLRELRLRERTRDDLVSPGLPYAVASPPLVEWNARYNTSNRRESYGLIARHDLFGFGHEWQAQATNNQFRDEYQLTRLRWRGSYYAAEEGSPEPLLGLQQLEVGDIRTNNLEGAPRHTQGRGVRLSSFPASQQSVFDTQRISGFAPPGWEADLYINQQLVDYQEVDDSGTYEFDALLQQGHNRVEVRLFGPLGEERVDRFTYQLGQDYLERGDFAFSLDAFQPERDLLGVEEERLRAETVPDWAVQMDLGIGIDPSLNLRGHLRHQEFQDDFDESNATQLGWTLGGNRGLWAWQWQQLFEGSDHFTRLEALRSTNVSHISLGFFNHPDWQVYQREGRLFEREYRLRSHYQLTPWRYTPLRLGLNANREEYERFNRNEAELTQQLRLFRWAFNFNQRCTFFDSDDEIGNDYCSFGHSTRYSQAGFRASLDTSSDYSNNRWQRHFWRSQLNYNLGRPFQRTRLEPWTEDFQLRGQYSQTHYPSSGIETLERWSYELTWQQTLRYVKFGWGVGRDSREGWNASLQLSGSLLPGFSGYHFLGDQLHRPAHIQAYEDTNYDGIFNRGEEPARDIAFRQRSRSSDTTDDLGQVWVNLLPSTELDLDLRSVEDPYIVSGREPLRISSRPERVLQLYWPLIETGALDGELISPEGRALVNQRIELRDLDQNLVQTMFTAFDGFWAFEFVPPGEYEIYWVQSEDSQLLAQVRLTPDDLWLSLLDLDVNEPRMLATAIEEEPEISEEVRQVQRSSRQAFQARSLQRHYTFLGQQQGQALLLDHSNQRLLRLTEGDWLDEETGVQLTTLTNQEAQLKLDSNSSVALPIAYQLGATQQLSSGEWVADLLWKRTPASSPFPYDRVSIGSRLQHNGEVVNIESGRVILQWQGEQLILEQHQGEEVNSLNTGRLDAEQLNQWPADAWTLQVMSSSNEAAVAAWVQQHNDSLPSLAYYRREHPSHPWVAVYGVYSSRSAAEAATANLPAALIAAQPWPRNYASIRAEISH